MHTNWCLQPKYTSNRTKKREPNLYQHLSIYFTLLFHLRTRHPRMYLLPLTKNVIISNITHPRINAGQKPKSYYTNTTQ